MQTLLSKLRLIGQISFVIIALVSLGLNGYHYYESQRVLEHFEYVGSADVKIGEEDMYMHVFQNRGTDNVFVNSLDSERSFSACVNLGNHEGQTYALDILGKPIKAMGAMSIVPYGVRYAATR